MKVAVLGPCGSLGGLQTHHEELKQFIKNSGMSLFSVDVMLSDSKNYYLHDRQSRVIRFGEGFSGAILKYSDWISAVIGLIRYRPDVCVANSNGFGYVLAGRVCKLFGYFAINMEVTEDFKENDSLRVMMWRAFAATAVQSKSLMAAQVNKLNNRNYCKVLPCFGRDLPSGYIAKTPAPGERIRISYFGRLAKNKGLMLLLRTVCDIPENIRPEIHIWGGGVIKSEIEEFVLKNKIGDSVKVCGVYPQGDGYEKLLSSYHGLVLPSQYSEGLPLVLLEAASVGVPFFSTNVGAIRDCVIGNMDARICEVGQRELTEGFCRWIEELRMGKFSPGRLHKWYLLNHSRRAQEQVWSDMLNRRLEFFKD